MIGKIISVCLLTLLLNACVTTAPLPASTAPIPTVIAADNLPAWRTCYFKITWPANSTPDLAVDLLLAHQLIGPVIAAQRSNMQSWRFHRRAARDNAGHLFSFHFYTGSNLAAAIIDQINQNKLRTDLLAANILESATCNSPNDISRPGIGDTSDPNWPVTIQNHWPAYIMGISELWLGLIDDAVSQNGRRESDLDKLVEQYREVNNTVTALWQGEGEHALLHHLNAIFGYEPININF